MHIFYFLVRVSSSSSDASLGITSPKSASSPMYDVIPMTSMTDSRTESPIDSEYLPQRKSSQHSLGGLRRMNPGKQETDAIGLFYYCTMSYYCYLIAVLCAIIVI